MKKIGYILMIFAAMFVLNSIVKAEEVTCVYAAAYEGLANSHYYRNNNNDPVLKKLGIPNGSIVNVKFDTNTTYNYSDGVFKINVADGFNYEEYYKQSVTVVNAYLKSNELSIRPLSGQGLAEWYKTEKDCPKYLMVDYIGSLYSSKGYIGYVTEENYDSYTYSGNSVNSENHFEVFKLYDTKVTSTTKTVKKQTIGVVCEYGEFKFHYVSASTNGQDDVYIEKGNVQSTLEIITNYYNSNPNIDSSDSSVIANKVNSGDTSICTPKAYITELINGKYDYMITGTNPETWPNSVKSSFPSFGQVYERQLTKAYCIDCETKCLNCDAGEIECPAKNDMSYGFVFDSNGEVAATVTNGKRHNVSEYTKTKSTEAGFIVDDVSKCPIRKSDFTVTDLKENDAVVRNHQTYAFATERSNSSNVVDDEYYNFEELAGVSCGKIENIPSILPRLLSVIYIIIQIAVPVLLVVLGMMDLIKSITANKDDEIKKAQGMFFKRLVSAVLVFFAFTLVKIVISAVSNDTSNLVSCMDCFIRNNCNKNGAWNCTIDEYTFSYHSNGSVGFVGTEGYNGGYGIGNIISEFKPSTDKKCPSSGEYTVVKTTGKKVNTYDFTIRKK